MEDFCNVNKNLNDGRDTCTSCDRLFGFLVQYYYSVRIFPGQEPSSVWVGWVTSDFHQYDPGFELHKVRTVTVTLGDEKGKVHERSVKWTEVDPLDILMGVCCGWSLSSQLHHCDFHATGHLYLLILS